MAAEDVLDSVGEVVKRLSGPLARNGTWLRVLGALLVLHGISVALSVIGLLVAWLPLWMGVLLWQAATELRRAHDEADSELAARGINRLRVFFLLAAAYVLLWLVISVLAAFGYMSMMVTMGPPAGR